jgi:hypothetical protein
LSKRSKLHPKRGHVAYKLGRLVDGLSVGSGAKLGQESGGMMMKECFESFDERVGHRVTPGRVGGFGHR